MCGVGVMGRVCGCLLRAAAGLVTIRPPPFRYLRCDARHQVMDLVSALNYLVINYKTQPDFVCLLQASVMQCFEVGSWIYTITLAVDLARGLRAAARMHSDKQVGFGRFALFRKDRI